MEWPAPQRRHDETLAPILQAHQLGVYPGLRNKVEQAVRSGAVGIVRDRQEVRVFIGGACADYAGIGAQPFFKPVHVIG